MFTANPNQTVVSGSSFSAGTSLNESKKNILPYIFTGALVLLNIAAVGAVAYGFHLKDSFTQQIEDKKKKLTATSYTETVPLQVMEDFSGRIKGVSGIFQNAPSAYSIFTVFENVAERGVSFGEMHAGRVEGTKSYQITVSGNAKSYDDIILQVQALRSPAYSKYVSNVKVAKYVLDPEKGGVTFTIAFMTSIGRFSTANLIIDLTKPDDAVPTETQKPVTTPQIPPKTPQVQASSTETELASSTAKVITLPPSASSSKKTQ